MDARTLNADAAEALRPFAPGAVTDVTGFGLLGHAFETAERSGVRLLVDAGGAPALPGALEGAGQGERTGGDRRNREFAGRQVESGRRRRRAPDARMGPQTRAACSSRCRRRSAVRRSRRTFARSRPLPRAYRRASRRARESC